MKTAFWMCMLGILLPSLSEAGVYWQKGVRSSRISVCFVGNATTSRAPRVMQILEWIQEYEGAGNLRFNYTGTCRAPTRLPNGNDYYDGDIRVVIPNIDVSGTGMVPGRGCPMFLDAHGQYDGTNDNWGSWSNAPDDLERNRSCLYNLKLGDDPWDSRRSAYLNHTLHEFGHALGLAHEHERRDVDSAHCREAGYGGQLNSYVTYYDRQSVMHYKFGSCGINGNYDDTGLSGWDRLSVHILYPEVNRVAEIVGTTVVSTTSVVHLRSAWVDAGAESPQSVLRFRWRINGSLVSTDPDLAIRIVVPDWYSFDLDYEDFLGRVYAYHGVIRVLTPIDYARQISGPLAAKALLTVP